MPSSTPISICGRARIRRPPAAPDIACACSTSMRPTIAHFGPWPWPRSVLARLAGELKAAGVSLVVFDMALDTPDPSSPAHFAASLPSGAAGDFLRAELALLPSPDGMLAAAMGGTRTITAMTLGTDGRVPAAKGELTIAGAARIADTIPDFASAAGPLAAFDAVSAGIGRAVPGARSRRDAAQRAVRAAVEGCAGPLARSREFAADQRRERRGHSRGRTWFCRSQWPDRCGRRFGRKL